MEQAYRSITWTTVVLVGALLPLSTAMLQSDAADQIADAMIGIVGGLGPYGLLVGLFVVTAAFGQLISNSATALIVIPIGLVAATEMGVALRPVLMSISVAASAALGGPSALVRRIATIDYPTPARRPSNSRLDCSLLAERHGLRLPPWQESVRSCVATLLAQSRS